MKRRRFIQAIAATPAAPALLAQQTPPTTNPAAQNATPRTPTPPPKLATAAADLSAQPAPAFFSADQYSALQRLGKLLVPAIKGRPGAVEAGAPEFLDFLIGVSPAERQKLYRSGLDSLNFQSKSRFSKLFAATADSEADAIVKPLLVVIEWPEDMPADPVKSFMAQAHEDLRKATTNSREWAASAASSGRRGRGFGGAGLYWNPIDPIYKG